MDVLRAYLSFPLRRDPLDVLPHHVANVELLQELGSLETHLHELRDFTALMGVTEKKCITDLLHYRRRGEPGVLLQDCFRKAVLQPHEVVLPHVRQVLSVINAGWLISGYETFNESRTKSNRRIISRVLRRSHPI